jgi:phosphohistidine phosphatase
VVRLPELEPVADPAALLAWLRGRRRAATVAVVGHEPHLSAFVGWALAGERSGFVELKKGGACLLDLGHDPSPGKGRLRWLLTPRQLRRAR